MTTDTESGDTDHSHSTATGNVTIHFPNEYLKTVVAGVFLALCFFLNTVSLVLTHQRLPERNPLPDIILDNIPTVDSALDAAEIIIMVAVISTMTLTVFHTFR